MRISAGWFIIRTVVSRGGSRGRRNSAAPQRRRGMHRADGDGQRSSCEQAPRAVVVRGTCKLAALDVSRCLEYAHLVPGSVLANTEDVAGDFDRAFVEISAHELADPSGGP